MEAIIVLFMMHSASHDLPPGLLQSLCYIESKHNIHAVHHDDGGTDSLGICQIKYKTAQSLGFKGTPQELMSPETNIKYAAKYLQYQYKRYGHSATKAVIAYNRGNARHLTTSTYQRKVFKEWRAFNE